MSLFVSNLLATALSMNEYKQKDVHQYTAMWALNVDEK